MSRREICCGPANKGSRRGRGFSRFPVISLIGFLAQLIGPAWAVAPGDPTEPAAAWLAAQPAVPGVAVVELSSPTMQMTLTGKSRRIAVIGGDVVKAGDQYNGSKVLAVKADKVVMEDAAKSLATTPNVTKTKPAQVPVRKKRVVLPAGDVSPKAPGSNQ